MGAPLLAEAVPAPPATDATNSGGLADIIVTAEKRASNTQKVPATIVAATGAELTNRGVIGTEDLTKLAPAIQIPYSRSQAIFFIRGFGQNNNGVNADPYVALNVDGAYLPSALGRAAFFDIDRVEILYGPQGTAYGRNALAGVVNVVTNRPKQKLGFSGDIEGGNFGTINLNAVANAPLTDTLAVRVAFNRRRHDGYESNGTYDEHIDNLRTSMLWQPDEATSVFGSFLYGHKKEHGASLLNYPALACGPFCNPIDAQKNNLHDRSHSYIGTLEISHSFGDTLKLTDTASYIRFTSDALLGSQYNIAGNSSIAGGAPNVRTYSNELRFNLDLDRMHGILDFYAFHENGSLYNLVIAEATGPASQVGPYYDTKNGQAVFAALTYSLTDTLRLSGALRYSHDKRRMNGANFSFPGGVQTQTQIYSNHVTRSRADFRAGAEFDVAPHSMLYATLASGYNEGGFSTAPVAAGSTVAAPYQPATGLTGILGMKNRFFNNQLQLNIEAFYNAYKNFQVSARNFSTGQNTIYNVDKARTYGVQVDSIARVTRHDELRVGIDFLHTKMVNFILPVTPFTDYSGFDLPFAPHFQSNVSYEHDFDFANSARLEFLINWRHVGSQWLLYSHANGTFSPKYDMADASLTYRPASRHWSFTLWTKNLSNAYVFGLTSTGKPGPGVGLPYPPRTYGVRASLQL